MKIEVVRATVIRDSRKEETILVEVNNCSASSPSGKSKGRYETPSYKKSIEGDVDFINHLMDKKKLDSLPEIKEFDHLEDLEKKLKNKIGANTLFAFESAVLKALAKEQQTEVWKVINPNASIFPRIISNTIGGGAHTNAKIKPDFQEFLVTCNKKPSSSLFINRRAHDNAEKILKNLFDGQPIKNDENAWVTEEDNERALEIMKNIQENVFEETGTHLDIGLDVAGSQFFKNGVYNYANRKAIRSKKEQIQYIINLSKKYNLFYIEDPLDEEDFSGFSELVKHCNCLIVGDDLTVTNLKRVEKAIKMEAITGVIVKPNQTGSLIEVKKVIELCKKNGIRTIMSHRSGETTESILADLAFAFQCDFIKIPVVGEERLAKVNRLKDIETSLKISISSRFLS
ncbi:MAG: enolase C-terminal domain-like protein [archaeon]|nr:enolase C-terminal domain-like protein [archaeon]